MSTVPKFWILANFTENEYISILHEYCTMYVQYDILLQGQVTVLIHVHTIFSLYYQVVISLDVIAENIK